MSLVIETEKLTKSYGKARGIIDVDLQVEEGEIFGFIGPNGAGKSTTIRTILGLIQKTSGNISVFQMNLETNREKILEQVGYLPSEVFYYDKMRAIDLLNYSASFYKKDCKKKIADLADILELDLKKKIEDMSLGNRKKVGIIQGLLHSPKLIILDEPTSGLDPLMQKTFFELMEKENKGGATILFSSHILGEVQKICDRVSIIKEGRIIQTQTIRSLIEHNYKKVSFHTTMPITSFQVDGGKDVVIEDNSVHFLFQGNCNELLGALNQYELSDIDITEPTLEEIFLHYYESTGVGA